MVPVYDLLNHVNGCPTYATTEPCSGGSEGGDSDLLARSPLGGGSAAPGDACIAIRTRVPVASGVEVCNTNGWLAPDHLAFHYGFLPHDDELEYKG